jgi:prefoldin subunit 5
MTPQEKAKELVDKFMLVNSESVELETGEHELLLSLSKEDANQCALIAVDEILYAYPHTYEMEKVSTKVGEDVYMIMNVRSNIAYWQEVKQEIEKL